MKLADDESVWFKNRVVQMMCVWFHVVSAFMEEMVYFCKRNFNVVSSEIVVEANANLYMCICLRFKVQGWRTLYTCPPYTHSCIQLDLFGSLVCVCVQMKNYANSIPTPRGQYCIQFYPIGKLMPSTRIDDRSYN